MGYGLGASSAAAFNVPAAKRAISIMGDGGFWHNGLSSGIGNAVFQQSDGVIVIVDNYYASATGGGTSCLARREPDRSTSNPIEAPCAVGDAMECRWIAHRAAKVRATIEGAHHRRQGPQGHHRAVRSAC